MDGDERRGKREKVVGAPLHGIRHSMHAQATACKGDELQVGATHVARVARGDGGQKGKQEEENDREAFPRFLSDSRQAISLY